MATGLEARIVKLEGRTPPADSLVTFGRGDEAITVQASRLEAILKAVDGATRRLPEPAHQFHSPRAR